jgi:Ala-tRNA(Pro) deacylase
VPASRQEPREEDELMPLTEEIQKFLDDNKVRYEILSHERAMTAQEVAHSVHITGKEVAKCVMVLADAQMLMVVIPAPHRLSPEKLKAQTNAKEVRLAREDEFRHLFPECELGAMPPFGSVYGLPVYMDKSLERYTEIVFNACTHTEVIKMSLSDFEALVKPTVGEFSELPA